MLSKFRDVLMCLSVDGYAEMNTYIRGGSHGVLLTNT